MVLRVRYAKLCEVASSLLSALVSMSVVDAQSKHCLVCILRVEDVFDLAFQLEESVLT